MVASAHLRTIRDNFRRIGIVAPTPEEIAWVWNVGWSGAVSRKFRPNDYAIRVGNLFRLSSAKPR
jgi:hypothetical protein